MSDYKYDSPIMPKSNDTFGMGLCADPIPNYPPAAPIPAEFLATSPVAAAKHDQAKPDLSLVPPEFLVAVAKAFMVGEIKYGRYNYYKGHKASQLVAAAMRHITAWMSGEENDPVDGQPHLGAAGACMAMLVKQQALGTLKDNRYKEGT